MTDDPLTDEQFEAVARSAEIEGVIFYHDLRCFVADCRHHRAALAEARAEIERLRGALEELLIVQNGPPLIREQAQWSAAVAKAEAALTPKEPQP